MKKVESGEEEHLRSDRRGEDGLRDGEKNKRRRFGTKKLRLLNQLGLS